MRRHLVRAGAVALVGLLSAIVIPSGPASAEPMCDRPVPPPACGDGGVEDPPPAPRDTPVHGTLDAVTYVGNAVRVSGWGIDRDSGAAPLVVDIYIDGAWKQTLAANTYRQDVADVYPSYGAYRGYDAIVPAGLGTHQVCAWAISVVPAGAPNPGNPSLGCRTYTATLAAPSNLRIISRAQDGTTVYGFKDNSVEETYFRITITRQYWEPYTDPRWGQSYRAYYVDRSITVPAQAGTAEVTATTSTSGSDCRTTVVAVSGSFQSTSASTGWC
ncbi:hypothetical protein KZZ52_27255 [Dactylosporangium sp. AC04546]|uniref:hypothetical protein n=1 Tax=Dactylosporangium sp. AC04546 TaxID=2862460 RepID=UPI001EE0B418|nr:hypothetical protein [Dactylosporangium sp. AC04546]WVK88965.1 hypothetical protein KZZ52_27255 [Dactylosporangium sp. AC04546]